MTEREAIGWLHSTPRFSRSPGLKRIRALLEALGEPQKRLRFVHIAGTNGKGSVAAMCASVLRAAGYRTGLFTSPYLENFRERMQLNGELISPTELADCVQNVKSAAETLEQNGLEPLNEFELVTAAGLLWFARRRAELVVLEVGLGGRFDATNVIEPPLAAAITSISLDHTAVLGNTLGEIAREKAGILKPGAIGVVSPNQPEEVLTALRQAATEQNATLLESDTGGMTELSFSQKGLSFLWRGRRLRVPLLGEYQRDNVCTVLYLIDLLRAKGLDIPDAALEEGLARVSWPGRLELLGENILLDAGHNPGGIDALCKTLDGLFAGRPIIALMGMLRDKDHGYCIAAIARRSAAFYAVSPPSPRALSPEEIAGEAADCPKVCSCASVDEGTELALKALDAQPCALLVCCGSIPLVGAVRQYLRERQETAKLTV